MSDDRLKVIRLQSNPRSRKRKGRRQRFPAKVRPRPRPRASERTRPRSARTTKNAPRARRWYAIEVMKQNKSGFSFLYWTGSKLSPTRAAAKRFSSENDALGVARKIIARLSVSHRLARVVAT